MIEKPRVAAVVTLYNSDETAVKAIASYHEQVEKIYVIDNSETQSVYLTDLLKKFSKVKFIRNDGNQGVATALNIAAELAIDDGFEFLLTMDDDTFLPLNAVHLMLETAVNLTDSNRIGIISGVHSLSGYVVASRAVSYTMTSGNLLNLAIYRQVGPFRDDFFIDHVDHEYGLRLNKAGFQVIEISAIQLHHQLGERKPSGWGTYQFVSHTPLRGYYMVRNGLVLFRLYPGFRSRVIVLIGKEWLKALLFEDHKAQRLRLLWRGICDAWRGKLGKFVG